MSTNYTKLHEEHKENLQIIKEKQKRKLQEFKEEQRKMLSEFEQKQLKELQEFKELHENKIKELEQVESLKQQEQDKFELENLGKLINDGYIRWTIDNHDLNENDRIAQYMVYRYATGKDETSYPGDMKRFYEKIRKILPSIGYRRACKAVNHTTAPCLIFPKIDILRAEFKAYMDKYQC